MGIEPTGHDSRRSPTGFEDQARHQTRGASEPTFYHRFSASPLVGRPHTPWLLRFPRVRPFSSRREAVYSLAV